MFDSEPFGQRAVRLGFVTSEQVREALDTQRLMGEKSGLIGEILVEMGWMDSDRYVEVVQGMMEEGVEGDREAIQGEFVGRALAKGYITQQSVEHARKIQAGWSRKNKLIGQVMVDMGYLVPADLREHPRHLRRRGKQDRGAMTDDATADRIYDTAIIGAGMAGYTAAIYCLRFRLSTVLLAREPGGS